LTSRKGAKGLFVLLAVLLCVTVVTVFVVYDPELSTIRRRAIAYVGDLQKRDIHSAGRRVFVEDLSVLKESALEQAALSREFRARAEKFFGVSEMSEMGKQTKELFFEFMIDKVYEDRPELMEALRRGKVAGVSVKRDGAQATADTMISLATDEGKRQFVMHLKLVRHEGEWWIRI